MTVWTSNPTKFKLFYINFENGLGALYVYPLNAPLGYYYNLLLSNCFTSSSLVQLHDVIIKKDFLSTLDLRRSNTFSMYFSRLLNASSGQRLIASYVPLSKQTSKFCVDNLDWISETFDKISHCYKFKIHLNFGIL